MRTIASWPQVIATTSDGGVQVQQYATAEVSTGTTRLAIETGYPWAGEVAVRVIATPDEPWELSLRVPAWCASASLRDADGSEIGRRSADGRAIAERRVWRAGDSVVLSLDMPARVTSPDPRVDAIRGCVALERGPLVYAVETADVPAGIELEDLALPDGIAPIPLDRPDIGPFGRRAAARPGVAGGAPIEFDAIPYYAWANREVAGMRVWIPRARE